MLLRNYLKTELPYTSNAIEGNTLTREEIAIVIANTKKIVDL